ncbi:MAG: UDP-N-acetylmuramoyl-tripeptide--D-alanyl-D-alanine ligase [Thiohalomonadales bacterium]
MSGGCQLNTQAAAAAMDAQLYGDDVTFAGVSIDTRTLNKGEIFFAITGPNFDGHEYVDVAQESGAVAVVVEQKVETSLPQLVVANTHLAIASLSSYWRLSLNPPLIAITGSNGKTSVKEMTASIMSQQGNTFATKGNLNNDLGVPLSLLSVDASHATVIIEMGANHPKEIEYLTHLAKPNIALVNNASAAHLEGFGDLDGVAKAKGEIYQGLCLGGYGIVNNDDAYADLWKEMLTGFDILTFAIDHQADIFCDWSGDASGSSLNVTTPAGEFSCVISLSGKHNVMNALAATAISIAANVPLPQIKIGLEKMCAVPGRLETKPGFAGATLIDDTYNANPTSTLAALAVLEKLPGNRYFILGDMGELGDDAVSLHAEIGAKAREIGIDALLGIGELSRAAVQAFGANGKHFDTYHELVQYMKSLMHEGSTLLVKGSRTMQMNKVVDACLVVNESSQEVKGEN